jgi:hypothetical protein
MQRKDAVPDSFVQNKMTRISTSISLVVDVCATSLADATTYMEVAFESEAFADAPAPVLNESLTPPRTRRIDRGFVEQKDPDQVRTEAASKATMAASRELHEKGKAAEDAVVATALIRQLGQKPKPGRRGCQHGRRKGRCKDCGTGRCAHGRRKDRCKDCGTGRYAHGRRKGQCRDCGTSQCQHGHRKGQCRDCKAGK